MNVIIIDGRLTRDPEAKYTKTSKTVCSFDVANNKGFGDKKTVCYYKVDVWGKQGESCAQYLKKGSLVIVQGEHDVEKWQDNEGVKREKNKIIAQRVHFMDKKPDNQGQQQDNFAKDPWSLDKDMMANDDNMPF